MPNLPSQMLSLRLKALFRNRRALERHDRAVTATLSERAVITSGSPAASGKGESQRRERAVHHSILLAPGRLVAGPEFHTILPGPPPRMGNTLAEDSEESR
jgi:hypothetical protein